MARKTNIRRKKPTQTRKAARSFASKEKCVKPLAKTEPNVLEVKGETVGKKGAELHVTLEGKDSGHNTRNNRSGDFHLYVGSKGGDKYDSS